MRANTEMIPKTEKIDEDGRSGPEFYSRFLVRHRLLHFVMMVSFFGLVFTGMPLKFSETGWAHFIMGFLGGASTAGFIHRLCALSLTTVFFVTVSFVIHFLFFNKKVGRNFWERLFGPDSLFFRKKDWEDFVGMIKWFTGTGPKPEFDRWSYWEKFDFFAVFWGMTLIGSSGLILWDPDITSLFLPGWIFNIAIIIHSDEALLAAGFIFTVHFFNTHFIPTKFPMDSVIFTGVETKHRMLAERRVQYERLKREGKLQGIRSNYPNILTSLFAGIVGYTAMLCGIIGTICILLGLLAIERF